MSAETDARAMGARAGAAFRTTGLPARNPFPDTSPALRKAWRRGYLAALAPR